MLSLPVLEGFEYSFPEACLLNSLCLQKPSSLPRLLTHIECLQCCHCPTNLSALCPCEEGSEPNRLSLVCFEERQQTLLDL